MQKLRLAPLTLSFIVWVLTLCAGLGGRTAMFGNPVISINTSQLGREVLNNSNLFNLDNSSILYTILFPENNTSIPPTFDNLNQINKDHGIAVPPKNGKALVPRSSGAPPRGTGTASTLISIAGPIYDFISDELRLNKTGFVYQTGLLILNNTSDKLGAETDRFIQRISVVVPSAVITALQAQLYALAQSYQIPPTDLNTRSVDLTTESDESEGPWAVPDTRQHSLHGPQLTYTGHIEHMRTTLEHDLAGTRLVPPNSTSLGQAIASGDFTDFLNGTIQGALTDLNGTINAITKDLDDPNSQNMAARMFHQSRPYLATALRQYANTQLNTAVGFVKSGFYIHDLYNIYMTQLCYADESRSGKVRYKGCRNVNDMRDSDLAPPIKKTLNDAGLYRRVPKSIKLGWGPESAIDGLSKITKLLFAIDLLGILFSGLSFWSLLFSLFTPHSWERWMDNLAVVSHVLAYTVLHIVFALSLLLTLACKLIIGNILYVFSGINIPGWGFCVMNIMSVFLMTVSVNFVIHIWLQNIKARVLRNELGSSSSAQRQAGPSSTDENSSEKGLVSHTGEPFARET